MFSRRLLLSVHPLHRSICFLFKIFTYIQTHSLGARASCPRQAVVWVLFLMRARCPHSQVQGTLFINIWTLVSLIFTVFSAKLYAATDPSLSTDVVIEKNVPVAQFASGKMAGWEEKEFSAYTIYQLKPGANGVTALNAASQASASGLFKTIHIDLNKTPYINWAWKIEQPLKGLNERSKQGDDYAARIYVVKKHALLFWKTRALNYVWSSNQMRFSQWDNAYTSQAKMLAVQGKHSPVGQWLREKRNVKQDFKKIFGEDINEIDVVAIMTDTDNSGRSASAWYGDIYFSAE